MAGQDVEREEPVAAMDHADALPVRLLIDRLDHPQGSDGLLDGLPGFRVLAANQSQVQILQHHFVCNRDRRQLQYVFGMEHLPQPSLFPVRHTLRRGDRKLAGILLQTFKGFYFCFFDSAGSTTTSCGASKWACGRSVLFACASLSSIACTLLREFGLCAAGGRRCVFVAGWLIGKAGVAKPDLAS